MKRLLPLLAAGLLLPACEPEDILNDPSFDIWCGDTLCSWEVEAGTVEKVPTWHSADHGVSLVGNEVILSQLVQATHAEIACIEFRILADTADDATISLELDFLDDDTSEYSHPLTTEDFQESVYTITPPSWFTSVRFVLHKVGEGDAIIGQLRALNVAADSCLAEPLTLNNRPDGAACEGDEQCSGGSCEAITLLSSDGPFTLSACSSCEEDADCSEGTCGVTADAPEALAYLTCEQPGSARLGEHCASDTECDTGICAEGQCSSCRTSDDCTDGETCQGGDLEPRRCLPDALKEAKEPCFTDSECASGYCFGGDPTQACNPDGRACTADTDCPWQDLGATCDVIGFHDGRCL